MEWWQAWLLWKLSAIHAAFLFFVVVSGILMLIFALYHACGRDNFRTEEKVVWQKRRRLLLSIQMGISGLIFTVSFLMLVCLPTTSGMMKIIATKYGVDAATSDQVMVHVDEAGRIVDRTLKNIENQINERLGVVKEEQKKE